MIYFVNLVQRGISANTHSVSGKSGKGYGTAVASPAHGGVILRMSLQDYLAAAHDLCGNVTPNQQWVPEFEIEVGPQAHARPKCDRCPKPAVAIWDRFHYCATDAPSNATWFDENEHQAWLASNPQSAPVPTAPAPDVLPAIVEPMTKGVTDKKANADLPKEAMPPPFMGSADEGAVPDEDALPPNMLRNPRAEFSGPAGPPVPPPIGTTQPPPAVASEIVEPAAQSHTAAAPAPQSAEFHQKPDPAAVVQSIAKGVMEALVPQLEKMIDDKLANRKPAPATPRKRDHRKKVNPSRPGPTEFQNLQKRAKELGINSYGLNRERLETAIKEKETPPAP